jgi:energy-coupling factor transporter transmembrane protein EcfT
VVNWWQCGLLWLFVAVTFLTPLVRNIGFRLVISIPGAILFALFAFLNAYNHGAVFKKNNTEIFGYPFSYYDNRHPSLRAARNGSDQIPGAYWASWAPSETASLTANLAVYFVVTTFMAWPIAAVETFMRRRKGTVADASRGSLHERPSWAR